MNTIDPDQSKQILFGETSLAVPSLSILLVEDNPGDVGIVKALIKSSGIRSELTHVSTLREALLNCIEQVFDVILLDLGLPDSVGLETLKKIQVFKVIPPIVVMTGLDDEDSALSSLREGAQDYIVKNKMTSETFIRSIKYGIERKRLQNLREKNVHQFSILSNTTAALNECKDISLIYRIICESINLLLENSNAISIEYIHRLTYKASNFGWLEPLIEKVNLLTGIDLKEHVFQFADQGRLLMNMSTDGNLHEIKGGLYELFLGNVDQNSCTELEKALGINYIYFIGFLKGLNFYGGAIIVSPNMIGNDDVKIIETIGSQASLNIYKRLIEKNLRLSDLRFRKLSEELEQKVKDRTEDLESLNFRLTLELKERNLAEQALKKSEAQLIEMNATKDKFFNIVAHDLKNPFTSLLGATELLYENINKMDSENIKLLAQILNDSAKSGYAILLNLLDWSRSQTGLIKFNPGRINLKSLIDDNISDLKLYTTNKAINLNSEIREDIFIFSDENMINTILRNLLSNAVKFTHKYGKVNVSLANSGDEVVISVKDTGIGISEDNIKKLFRIDSKYTRPGTEKEQGTGLGLKLCKEFVEKMEGKIWVESTENEGSEFIFSIPVKENPF